MKKICFMLIFLFSSFTNVVTHPPKKKSKEAAVLKAAFGTYYTIRYMNFFLDYFCMERPFPPSRPLFTQSLLLIIASWSAKQGFNDLEEIAQTE